MEQLAERIAWAITKIKETSSLTDVQLGELLGVDKNTIAAYRQKKGSIKGVALEGLSKHFNYDSKWLLTGKGEPYPDAHLEYPEVYGSEGSPAVPPAGSIPASVQPDFPPDDYVFIGRVKGKISAGGGLTPDNAIEMRLAFRKDWLKRKGNPNNMSLIKVSGDSMEPTLLSGDIVLVDHSRTSVAPQGGIYAISIDHEIMIKRVQVLFHEGKLRIISDNKQYEPIEATPDKVRINGKVIWFGRDLER